MRPFRLLPAVFALAAGLVPALAEAPSLAPGIYAVFQDQSAGEALPEDLAEAVLKTCKNRPALVYPDGLIAALRPNEVERMQAGGPFFLPAGAMHCAALSGEGVACRNFEGESLTEAAPLSASFAPLAGGIWRIAVAGRDMSLLLAPCEAAIYDITLPNGRNIRAEMTARSDGGPALTFPAN